MMREYSITTCEGSCTPQKTADPSIAGVKKGRPLIVSTIRNHRATAAAPRQPATNPSRKIRVSCMRSPGVGWVNISPGTARARLGPTARRPTDDRLATLGFGGWMVNVLFMVGAGGRLARAYATAEPGLGATQAIFVYDMLHPFGLAAERIATFTVGLALYAYGWAIRNGQVYPRWLAWLGIAIGATAAAVAVAFTEFSLNMFYAQALVVAWFAVVGALMLRDARGRLI